ncbi:Tyrosine recombinase XerD [subsurface metagenome]
MFFIEEFLTHLQETRYSRETIREYRYLLQKLKDYIGSCGITEAGAVSEKEITGFLEALGRRNGTGRSHYLRLIRLRKYFSFLEERGFIFLSPTKDCSAPRYPNTSFPVLQEKEIRRILSRIKTDHPLCIKGKAMMGLMYSSALRPREIYNLKLTDVDFKKGLLFIEQSKNRKDRIVPVGKEALFWTKNYLKVVRPRYIKTNSHNYIFINHKNVQELSVWGVRWAIQQSLRLSGLKPIKPYSLLATAATALLLNGMGIGYISKLLGHTEIRTTQVYLRVQHLDLKKEMEKKHPRNKLGGKSHEV